MEACPKCGEEGAVDFDVVLGISACAACGAVLDEEQLVSSAAFDEGGGRLGTFVGAGDTGETAGAYALPDSGAGLAIQHSRRPGGEAKVKERVRDFCALLQLQPSVTDQAVHLLSQAAPHVLGNWRREFLAGAVTYAACRLNSLPLTLADLAGPAHTPAHTLGKYYRTLCLLLDLHPPAVLAPALLPRCLARATSEAVRSGTLTAAQVAALQRDAGTVLDWMRAQMRRQASPLPAVGAALVLAAEMNTISLSLDHISASLSLPKDTLHRALGTARTRLVELAAFLPYASTINHRNVGSHARMIMQLAALVGATNDGGGAAGGSTPAAALTDAAPGGTGNGAAHAQTGQGTQQPVPQQEAQQEARQQARQQQQAQQQAGPAQGGAALPGQAQHAAQRAGPRPQRGRCEDEDGSPDERQSKRPCVQKGCGLTAAALPTSRPQSGAQQKTDDHAAGSGSAG